MNYLLPPLTGGFWPVMVSVGSSPIRRRRSAPTPWCALPHQSMDESPIVKVGEIVEWVDNLVSLVWSCSGYRLFLPNPCNGGLSEQGTTCLGSLVEQWPDGITEKYPPFPVLFAPMADGQGIYRSEWNSLWFHAEQKGARTTRVGTSEKRGETYGNTNGKRRRATGYRGR